MRSRAHLKSHPLHPMLIGFPIAFFMGAFSFDVLYLLVENDALRTTGYHLVLAGLIGGLLAAVPGVIDFIKVVPPNSSAKKRAAKHGILNAINLILFVVIFFLKKYDAVSFPVIVSMEAVGVILLATAGWLGGTLVYRNQIGVDHRYAEAGKWKEEYISSNKDTVLVAKKEELKVDQMKLIHLGGKRIVIAHTQNGYAAFSDYCTHKGGSLAGGVMVSGTVFCPWHGSQFNVQSGEVKAGPACKKIAVYNVEEKYGAIYLLLNQTTK